MLKALQYQVGQLKDLLGDLQDKGISGAVYIDATVNPDRKPKSRILVLNDGKIVYGGLTIPANNQELARAIGIALNHSVADFAIKYAAKKLKNPSSFRELLEQIVQIRVFKWERIEAAIQSRVAQVLEQVLPHPGELRIDTSLEFDLSYGQDGHGLSWSELIQDVSRRQQQWAALAPVIPSMDAVPKLSTNVQSITDSKVQQHLWQWVDGVRSLVDIAAQLGEDPLQLAQSYRAWLVSGWVTFKEDTLAPPVAAPAAQQQRPLILSVDDSMIVQTMIKRALGDRYQVLLVSNAVEALKVINTNPIALLLLDVTMPDIDGLEFCQTVRSISKFKNLPIVMLTARDKFSDKLRGKIVGATHYLTKPVEPDQLIEIVDKCVQNTSANSQALPNIPWKY